MGFEDRDYSRQERRGGWGILAWLWSGSVPLFTVAGIRVRAHSSLVVLAGLVVLLGLGDGFTMQDRVLSMSVLFVVILLHEFGHCFAARAVGGEADQIMMSPLGGLAFAMAPKRPLPTFLTVAAGPAVNVVLMLLAAVVIYAIGGQPGWNPLRFGVPPKNWGEWWNVFWYAAWFFKMNYWLLLFNLMPSFPLDGGQMLQAALWKPLGYYKSMLYAVTIGIGGAGLMILAGVAGVGILLAVVGLNCMLNCLNMRSQILAAGPWAFAEEEDGDYSAASWSPAKMDREAARVNKAGGRAAKEAQRQADMDAAEQRKIDAILEKVHQKGMNSLTYFEKRTLKQATERQRQQNLRR